MKLNSMFQEFNTTYSIETHEKLTTERLIKTCSLIEDEVNELDEELFIYDDTVELLQEGSVVPFYQPRLTVDLDQGNVVKELTDILYITMQQMTMQGLDVEACLKEVHRSNMSKRVFHTHVEVELEEAKLRYPQATVRKLCDEWSVLIDSSTGKVIKPLCYTAANMENLK